MTRTDAHSDGGDGPREPAAGGLATCASPGSRLLAGPGPGERAESLLGHVRRLGVMHPDAGSGALDAVRASGLTGRGGGEFPFAEKLAVAAAALGDPMLVVNGSEGEPASRKDRALLELRPHLVLDGATYAAGACRAHEVALYLEPGRRRAWDAVQHAIWERQVAGVPGPAFRLVPAPRRFVAGESSALVSVLEGGGALPRRRRIPVAACGAGGRPTVVGNVETIAHLGLISRFGPEWFRQAGTPRAPGSSLVTIAGHARWPGLVVEIVAPVSLGELLWGYAGAREIPEAVLVGGYGGRFVRGTAVWEAPADRSVLRAAGVPLGCGVIAPVGPGACGLGLAHQLLLYLAAESSGQCGACAFGLPELARRFGEVLSGHSGRGGPVRLERRALELEGRGGCAHPDGAIGLLVSALRVFGRDAQAHARGRPCGREAPPGWFPTDPVRVTS